MPDIGPMEVILVLAIALLVLGPSKLPEIGKSLGSSIREFRKAATDVQDSVRLDMPARPPATPVAPATSAPAAAPAPPATPGAATAEETAGGRVAPPSASPAAGSGEPQARA
jgi:sec-independent protein translocase protein TatA